MEPTPTADLDRSNDKVYDCTTSVVKAVMSLSQGKISYVVMNLCSFEPFSAHWLLCVPPALAFRNLCAAQRMYLCCIHVFCVILRINSGCSLEQG
jgi:hypothetical protein